MSNKEITRGKGRLVDNQRGEAMKTCPEGGNTELHRHTRHSDRQDVNDTKNRVGKEAVTQ